MNIKKFILWTMLAVALVLILSAFTGQGSPLRVTTSQQDVSLMNTLIWLATGGGAVIVLSWVSERIPAFQALQPQTRWWIQLIGSVVLAIGAKVLILNLPQSTLDAVAPYFETVAGIVLLFVANQVAHTLDPKT